METNTDKSKVLQETFFLRAVTDGVQHEEANYLDPKFKFEPITNTQIQQAISHLGLHKWQGLTPLPR